MLPGPGRSSRLTLLLDLKDAGVEEVVPGLRLDALRGLQEGGA